MMIKIINPCNCLKWALWGLNPGPADYESDALTAELKALNLNVLTSN